MNGYGTQIEEQELEKLPSEFIIPTEEGFTFEGWYLDSDCINEAIPGMKLTSNLTLYGLSTTIFFLIS